MTKSPERMAALKKAINERVYPSEMTDSLMLNPLYRTVMREDFISEFYFNCQMTKAVIHYCSDR